MTASIYLGDSQVNVSLAASGEQGTEIGLYAREGILSVQADDYQLIDQNSSEGIYLLVESDGRESGVQVRVGDDEITLLICVDGYGKYQLIVEGQAFQDAVDRSVQQRIKEITDAFRAADR